MPLPPDLEAERLTTRGQTLIELKDFHQARSVLEQALELWYQAKRVSDAAQTLRLLALVTQQLSLPWLAKEYLQQARDIIYTDRDQKQEADILVEIGRVVAGIGEKDQALASYAQAQRLYQKLDDREAEGVALYMAGKVHQEAGDTEAAIPFFQQAFPLLRRTSSWTEEVAEMEQFVDTLTVAHNIFGLLGGKNKRDSLTAITNNLSAQAAAGSPTAARLFDAFSAAIDHASHFLNPLLPHRVQQHLTELTDPNPKKRCEAVRALAAYTPEEAIDPLFELLGQDGDPALHKAILQALRAYKRPAFVDRLQPFLHHPNPDVRLAVMIARDELGEPALDQHLLEGLQAQDAKLRAETIQILEKRRNPASADALVLMLADRDPKVRSRAIYALGTLGATSAVEPIIAATNDRYQVVRWAAVRVLGNLRDKRSVSALIARLQDKNRDVRRSAAAALGKLKDPAAIDALSAALTDDWWGVRESAQAALRKLKAAPSLAMILTQLHSPSAFTRCMAIELLSTQPPEAVIPALRELLGDQESSVRLAAIKALAARRDLPSLPIMLAELTSNHPVTLVEVIDAIGKMGDSSAEPALIDALRHENPYVRYASIQALREIGTRESLPALTAIQIHDESMVHLNHGFDFVSLKMAAATATHAIRARHQLKT